MARLPKGIVDTHIHSGPDVVPRLLTDVEVAQAAEGAGYRAVVLKSHHTLTSVRATMAEHSNATTRVFGGLVLNLHASGGLNPYAVDTALKLGARVIWLPTFTSANQIHHVATVGVKSGSLKALGGLESGGVETLDPEGKPLPVLCEILDLIAGAGATLATGHVSSREIMAIVPEARSRGVPNILVTHPEMECVELSVENQIELQELGGIWFERVYAITRPASAQLPIAVITEAIRSVGVDSTVMATDFGQINNPPPVEGMANYVAELRDGGFSMDEIEIMTCRNPAQALGLPEL